MYTEPKIFTSNDLKKRSYIIFYLYGMRIRIYNGHCLGKKINPNYATTIDDRHRLLNELLFEIKTALKNNTFKVEKSEDIKPTPKPSPSTFGLLTEALNKKLQSDLSNSYKTDLQGIYNHFIEFLSEEEKAGEIGSISLPRIEEFLSRYSSSGTYYMNKRRTLGVLFSSIGKSLQMPLNVIRETETRRTKATLHKIYDKDQMKKILAYLKEHHNNLYLCCLLSYGCFLRPHQEVRNLKFGHFKKDFTEIHLAGNENKGKSVRVVFVPDYVQVEFKTRVTGLKPDSNIFSLTTEPLNVSYFNTAWSRMWAKMNKEGLIEKQQTIYSFRHTAAVDVFRRTKDVYLLQKLLGHSTIVVTLKYLRGLGEFNMEELREAAPQL